MVFKIIGAVFLILLMFLASVWLVKGVAYSYKVQKEINGEEQVCYFDRGFIKTPIIRICRDNESLTFTIKEFFED